MNRPYALIVLAVIAALALGFFAVPYLLPMKYDNVDAAKHIGER